MLFFNIRGGMTGDRVFILINLYNPNTEKEQVSIWEKMNLMHETFNDLESRIIILGGDFNLLVDSVLDSLHHSGFLQRRIDYFFCFKYLALIN